MGNKLFEGIEIVESGDKKGLILKYSYLKTTDYKLNSETFDSDPEINRFHEEEWIVSPEYHNIMANNPYYILVKDNEYKIVYFFGIDNFTDIENVKLKYIYEGKGDKVNIAKVFSYYSSALYKSTMCAFAVNNKYGLVDLSGIVLNPVYDDIAFLDKELLNSQQSIIVVKNKERLQAFAHDSGKIHKICLPSRKYSTLREKVIKKLGIDMPESIEMLN